MYHKTWYIRMYSANWQTTIIKWNVSGKVYFMKFQIQQKPTLQKQHFTLTASSFYPICHMPRCLNATTSPSRFASRMQSLELELPSGKNTVVLQNIKNKWVGNNQKTMNTHLLTRFYQGHTFAFGPNTSRTETPGARESRCWKHPKHLLLYTDQVSTTPFSRHPSVWTLACSLYKSTQTGNSAPKTTSSLLVTRIHPIPLWNNMKQHAKAAKIPHQQDSGVSCFAVSSFWSENISQRAVASFNHSNSTWLEMALQSRFLQSWWTLMPPTPLKFQCQDWCKTFFERKLIDIPEIKMPILAHFLSIFLSNCSGNWVFSDQPTGRWNSGFWVAFPAVFRWSFPLGIPKFGLPSPGAKVGARVEPRGVFA